jgi:hypothetical protein
MRMLLSLTCFAALCGCASWNDLSPPQKGAAVGASVGVTGAGVGHETGERRGEERR